MLPKSDTALVLVLNQAGFFFLLLGDFGGDSAHAAVLSWLGKPLGLCPGAP